jgi:isoquinoline 1-oxidoreductase subunit beta
MAEKSGNMVVSRRAFVLSSVAAAGALVIGLRPAKINPRSAASEPAIGEIHNWVVVAPDNTVTVRIPQAEMGQGAMTSTVQVLAEELELDWSKIKTEFISLSAHLNRGRAYGRTETSASIGLRLSELPLRTAGAQIRTMLIRAAAHRFGVPESELIAENSVVTHVSSGRKLTYGELAVDAAQIPVPNPKSIVLKDSGEWKLLGKSVPRVDLVPKINGTAVFGIDVKIPGMKHAAIMMSPVFGGKLISYDSRPAMSISGVHKVLKIYGDRDIRGPTDGLIDDALVVVADDWWQANRALGAIPKKWAGGPWAKTDSIAILENLRSGVYGAADKTLRKEGDARASLSATRILEAEYFAPYLEQATMEPMNCTALVTDDYFEVWAPTQHPEDAIQMAAKVAGLPVTKGELHVTQIGGGFGRRTQCDFVNQAVQIAKAMQGSPVKLVWSREETLRHSFYRQASISRLRGGFDANGDVLFWAHRIVAQSRNEVNSTFGSDTLLYAIPNVHVDLAFRHSHVPEGSMRGVGFSLNCFAVQSFVDELARAIGQDVYEFQRKLLDPSHTPPTVPLAPFDHAMSPSERAAHLRSVLDVAAAKAHWNTPLEPGRGRGLAIQEQSGGFYAVVVEVTLDGLGWFKVDRVVVAGDPGLLANPDNAHAQVEGSVAYGLTSAIYGEITLKDGRVVEGNFNDYEILRIGEMPEVEVHWVLGREFWGDVSQSVVSLLPPALTNAIYDAGGPRVRSLPIKKHKIVSRN